MSSVDDEMDDEEQGISTNTLIGAGDDEDAEEGQEENKNIVQEQYLTIQSVKKENITLPVALSTHTVTNGKPTTGQEHKGRFY